MAPAMLFYDTSSPPKNKKTSKEILGLNLRKIKPRRLAVLDWRWSRLTRRWFVLIPLFLYLVIGPVPFLALRDSITALVQEQKIVNSYSTSCAGEWQNSQGAQGLPELDEGAAFDLFSEVNSAVYTGGPVNLICGGFQEEKSQTAAAKKSLGIFWGKKIIAASPASSGAAATNATNATEAINATEPSPAAESALSPESQPEAIQPEESSASASAALNATSESSGSSHIIILNPEPASAPAASDAAPEEPTDNPAASSPAVASPQNEKQIESAQILLSFAMGDKTSDFTPVSAAPAGKKTAPKSIFSKIGKLFAGRIVYAEEGSSTAAINATNTTEATNATTATEAPTEIESPVETPAAEPETSASTTETLAPAQENSSSTDSQPVTETFLQNLDTRVIVWYSLDGQEWWKLTDLNSFPTSNAINGGYLAFDAPFLKTADDIKSLQIKLEGAWSGDQQITAYLDSVWVRAAYSGEGVNTDDFSLLSKKDFKMGENAEVRVRYKKQGYVLSLFGEALGIQDYWKDLKTTFRVVDPEGNEVGVSSIGGDVREDDQYSFSVKLLRQGEMALQFSGAASFKPGKYRIFMTVEDDSGSQPFTQEFEQDFTLGVLAVNVSKSIYLPGEQAYLQMAALNDRGRTLCNAYLNLEVTAPDGKIDLFSTDFANPQAAAPEEPVAENSSPEDLLVLFGVANVAAEAALATDSAPAEPAQPAEASSTESAPQIGFAPEESAPQTEQVPVAETPAETPAATPAETPAETSPEIPAEAPTPAATETGKIEMSGACTGDSYAEKPDYFAYYQTSAAGAYQMKFSNMDTGAEITDSFEVRDYVPFDVERIGPTRIFPPSTYKVTLKVKANEDFSGDITERVPGDFVIKEISPDLSSAVEHREQFSVLVDPRTREIGWQANLKQNDSVELSYKFRAPNVSPYLYLLGPLRFESRSFFAGIMEKAKDFIGDILQKPVDAIRGLANTENSSLYSDFVQNRGKPNTENSSLYSDSGGNPENQQEIQFTEVFREARQWSIAADATLTLYPNATGTYRVWPTIVATTTAWGATSDLSDTTYIQSASSSTATETEAMQDFSGLAGSSINSVTINTRCCAANGGGAGEKGAVILYTNGAGYQYDDQTISRCDTWETNTSGALTANPQSGNPWTIAEVDAMETGKKPTSVGAAEAIRCSEFEAVVDYTIPPEGPPSVWDYSADTPDPLAQGAALTFSVGWQDTEAGASWTQATAAAQWVARDSHTSLVFNPPGGETGNQQAMWVMGGWTTARTNDVWYSVNGTTWTQATTNAQWVARDDHTSLVFNNQMWVLGGWTTARTNDVWYSGNGTTWTQATTNAQWAGRYQHTSLVFNNQMWVIGGTGAVTYNDVWYSTNGATWTQATAAAQWLERYTPTSLVFNNQMWVIGGYAGTRQNDVWYSGNGTTWTKATANAQWVARYLHTSLVFNNQMWVMGGETPAATNDVWYSGNGTTWTKATTNAQWAGRYSHTSLVFNNQMWALGGYTTTSTNDVWYSSGGELAYGHFCKTAVLNSPTTGGSCTGGSWYSSPAATSTNPITGTYTATSVVGTQPYFAFACSDGGEADSCSATTVVFGASWEDAGARNDGTGATKPAEWSARDGFTALVFNALGSATTSQMWVIGGSGSTNDVWYSGNGTTWTKATTNAQWLGRYNHTSLVFNNQMWVIGGGGSYNDVWYSGNGTAWTQATANAQWPGRYNHTSLVFNNQMWVLGGYAGSNQNDVWYSTNGATWTQATTNAQWPSRAYHTSLVFNNQMWVIGGSGSTNDVWYSGNGTAWTQATTNAQWTARYDHSSLVFNNQMWALGGWTTTTTNDVWYSGNGTTWTQATANAQWADRYRHTSLVFNNQMWVLGGDAGGGSCSGANRCNDVWRTPSAGTFYVNTSPQVTSASDSPDPVEVDADITFTAGWDDGNIFYPPESGEGISEFSPAQEASRSDLGARWGVGAINAQWPARYNHSSLVFNNQMWVIGGTGAVYLNDVWYSGNGATWTQATTNAQWAGRYYHTSLVFNNQMWVLGGFVGGTACSGSEQCNDVWYSGNGTVWTQATANAQWGARSQHTSLVYNNQMWVIGGRIGTNQNDVWYSGNGTTWTRATAAAQWPARYRHTSLVFNNQMWVLGGYTTAGTNDVWYSGNGTTWTQATTNAQWVARYFYTSLIFNNQMWVLGGDTGIIQNDVWYSGNGTTWTKATTNAQWTARYSPTSLVFNNQMWVIGGYDSSSKRNDVWYSLTETVKAKLHICKTNAIDSPASGGNCTGGSWADTASFSSDGTQTATRTATTSDVGTQDYWAFSCDDKGATNSCSSTTTGIGDNWTQARSGADWQGRGEFTSLVFNSSNPSASGTQMWVIGGWGTSSSNLNDVWYSNNGTAWTQATANAQWLARNGLSSLVFNNQMWVIGGKYSNDVWYSGNGTTWTQATANAQWLGRGGHTTVVFATSTTPFMWMIGGWNGTTYYNDVWYSDNGTTWTKATANAQWLARNGLSSLVFNNQMWVIGGCSAGDCTTFNNDVWYSGNGTTWTQATAAAQWVERRNHTSLVFNNQMWVIGGSGDYNDVWYSGNGTTWTQATAAAQWVERRAHTSLVFNNQMWVIGGYTGTENDVWYSPRNTGIFTVAAAGLDISGRVCTAEPCTGTNGSSACSVASVVGLSVEGASPSLASCNTTTGAFSFTAVTISSGQTATLFLDGNAADASAVLVVASADITDLDFYESKVVVRAETGAVGTTQMALYDSDDQPSDILFQAQASASTTLVSNTELHVWTGDTFDPNGTVTTQGTGSLHVDDSATAYLDTATSTIAADIIIDSGATLSTSSTTAVNGGDITMSGTTPTITYTTTPTLTMAGEGAIGGGTTPSITFYNLILGATATTSASSTMAIDNDLTVNGLLQGSNTATTTVKGHLTGTGKVNMTGGTIEQRVAGDRDFGTTSGFHDSWTFNNLQFSNSGAAGYTITMQGGDGTIDIGGILTVGLAGDTASTTLIAGTRDWSLSNTGTPFALSSTRGNFTASTSTFSYTGTAADVNVAAANYYYLRVGLIGAANSVTYTLLGNATTTKTFTVGASSGAGTHTFDALAYTMNLSGTGTPFVIASQGAFTASTSTFAYTGDGATNITATGTYYTLSIGKADLTASTTYTALGNITANNQVNLQSADTGEVNTFALGAFNLTVGSSSAANSGGIAVPVRTVLTQGAAGNTVVSSSSGGAATIGGVGTTTLYNFTVGAASDNLSYAFTLGGALTVSNNLTIASGGTGTHTLDVSGSNYGITIGGSWDNDSAFTRQSGAVTFTATSTGKTISDNGYAFYDMSFTGASGGWTYTDEGTVTGSSTNSTTLSAGTANFINARTGTVSVAGGTLNVDWYVGIHLVDGTATSTDIATFSAAGQSWTQATANAQWVKRSDFTSLVFNNQMWVLGGSTGSVQNNVWYSGNGTTWTQATANAQWVARYAHTSLVFNNQMWVIGGFTTDRTNDVWYSGNGTVWTRATANAQWVARNYHTSLVFNNQMWVIGGSKLVVYNDVWYSGNGTVWTQTTTNAQWPARDSHTSLVFNNQMWVIGGGSRNDVWYSGNGTVWTQATANAQWVARAYFSSLVFNNQMWVIGGWTTNAVNDVWYSGNGTTWTKATANAQWAARAYFSSLVFNNQMWVMGGYNPPVSTYYNDVWSSSGDNKITISEATGSSTVFWHNGTGWETGATSETTDTSASGTNPSPEYAGAIRLREYSMTNSATCPGAGCALYKYNLQTDWVLVGSNNYGPYDYYADYGKNYIISCLAGGSSSCSDSALGAEWTQATASARWLARAFHTSLVFNNQMWVMGGNTGSLQNDVWYSGNGTIWTRVTANAQWTGRRARALVFNNQMWMIGGLDPSSLNDVWYSGNGTVWTQVTANAQWKASSTHTLLVFNNQMWVIGGGVQNDVWYSGNGTTWTQATANAQWLARTSHTSLVFNNQMWVIGGYTSTSTNDVWYSGNGTTWTQATANAQWVARDSHTSLVFNNQMWAIGGTLDGGTSQLNDVWYSGNGTTWTQATAVAQWVKRYLHTSLVFNNQMWVIGGYTTTYTNDVWYSAGADDIIGSSWHRATPGTVNGAKDYDGLNQPPLSGTWYAGLLSGLSVSLSNTAVDLGELGPSNSFTSSSGTTTITVTTSASTGYIAYVWAANSGQLKKSDAAVYISAWTGTNSLPTNWNGNCPSNSECGFGYTTDDGDLSGGGGADRFTASTGACGADNKCWAGFATAGPGDPVADSSAPAISQQNIVTYKVSTDSAQAMGQYQTTVVYVVTAQY